MSTVAKKQHYVWQYYLKPWTNKGQLFCYRQKERKMFRAGTKGVATETYFYRLEPLSPQDEEYINKIINQASIEELRELNRGTLEMFQTSARMRKLLTGREIRREMREVLERELDKLERTMGERFHTSIEEGIMKIFSDLRNLDASFFATSEDALEFIYFLMHQFFRTPKLRNLDIRTNNPFPGLDLKRTWLIETHIYATNVGFGIYLDRCSYCFTFLRNESPIPFITTDQPVISLRNSEDEPLRLYYPLSPSLALLFEKRGNAPLQTTRDISRLEIEHYNHQMFSNSDDQIYSSDRKYLLELVKCPKNVVHG
jgi:hypothetical protein